MILNSVPKQGKYGEAIDTINSNFDLLRQAVEENHDGASAYEIWQEQDDNRGKSVDEFLAWMKSSGYDTAYAADDSEITEENVIYAVPDGSNTNLWHEKILVNNVITLLATHSGSLSGLADTFVQVSDNETDVDLDFKDEQGNVIVQFKNGHIQTSKFDSKTLNIESPTDVGDSDYDFDIKDENGNTIFAIVGGHIKTSRFDSRDIGIANTIYCVGDSITQGQTGIDNPISDNINSAEDNCYPNILQNMLGSKFVVKNLGVGGQSTGEVFVRCGMLDAIVNTQFTLNGNGTESVLCVGTQGAVDGVITDNLCDEPVNYMMQQGKADAIAQMSTCYINGIQCILTYNSPNLYIRRKETESYDVVVKQGTHITFGGNQKDGIYLVRVGTNDILQNGATLSVDNYIEKLKHSLSLLPSSRFIVMGLFHGWDTATTNENTLHEKENEMNAALSREFGARYIDGMSYISSYQIFYEMSMQPTTDADISQTRATAGVKSDVYCIEHNMTPSSFWRYSCTSSNSSVDKVHLNYDGYCIVAKMFYDKIKELNWM